MTAVACFGEIMLRLSPPGSERLFQSALLEATWGGGEANVAVSLAQYGTPSRFLTVLPENSTLADAVTAELRRFGVDTSKIVSGPGRMGIYFLENGANQRPSRVIYDRAASAISIAKPGDIDWAKALDGAGWLHITGITPALSQSAADLSLEALRFAKAAGMVTSCDLNYRKNLWKYGKTAADVMPEVMALTDHCIANEEDCQKALNIHVDIDVESGRLEHELYRELTERVMARYENLQSIAITMRESRSASHNGWSACLHTRERYYQSKHYEITHIVDRVGSGDSFAGGLIYGLVSGRSPADSLEFATAAACLKHSIRGDFHRITKAEVDSLIREGGSGRVQR